MAQKTISSRFATLIAIIAAAFMVTACGGDELAATKAELATTKTKLAQALMASANVSTRNTELAAAKQQAEHNLVAEQSKVADLSHKLKEKSKLLGKTQVALAHKTDEVKGAKQVAGTAVDHAHAKGVQVGKAATTKPAKKTS